MSSPLDRMRQWQKDAVIAPTEAAIEEWMSPAGTYLWIISDDDISALRAGSILAFRMEDYETVLIKWYGETPCATCGQIDQGQTGEYPCTACGLPRLHDEVPG